MKRIDARRPAREGRRTRQVPRKSEASSADLSVSETVLQLGRAETELHHLRQQVVARLRARAEEVSRGVVARYQAEVGPHVGASDPAMEDGVVAAAQGELSRFFETLVRGNRLPKDFLARHREVGLRRSAQGVPLAALLRGYEEGIGGMWHLLVDEVAGMRLEPEMATQLLSTMGSDLVKLTSQIAETLAYSYRVEAEKLSDDKEYRQRELIEELLSGVGEADELSSRARALGLRLGSSHVVMKLSRSALNLSGGPST